MVASYGGQILIEGCCIEGNGGPCQCGTVVLLCNPPSSFQQLGGFRWDRIEHLSRLFCCTDLFSLQNVLTRACLYGRGAGARTFLYAEIRGPYQDKSDRVATVPACSRRTGDRRAADPRPDHQGELLRVELHGALAAGTARQHSPTKNVYIALRSLVLVAHRLVSRRPVPLPLATQTMPPHASASLRIDTSSLAGVPVTLNGSHLMFSRRNAASGPAGSSPARLSCRWTCRARARICHRQTAIC